MLEAKLEGLEEKLEGLEGKARKGLTDMERAKIKHLVNFLYKKD